MVHRTPVKWQGCVPQRYILVIMGALAIFNAYTMRSAMSVAITEMADTPKSNNVVVGDSCPALNNTASNAVGSSSRLLPQKAEFEWDELTQGNVLGGLYWGYVAFNIPNGLLADRFGGKRLMLIGIMIASISTMLIPLAARSGGPTWITVARFLEGAGESSSYPGCNNMLAFWAPSQEKSAMGSIIFSGNLLGQVVGTALSGVIIRATGDWAAVFYVFGGIGVLWCVAFYFLCFDSPALSPRISEEEKQYIETSIKATSTKRPTSIPWFSIIFSLPVWALIIGQMGHDWALFTLGSELPKYMKSVLHYSIEQNGLISALPNLVTWLTAFFSGWFSDWLIRTEKISISAHRKVFTTFSTFMPGVGLLAASFAGCERTLTVALFCVGMATMGPFYCSLKVNALDISPNYSGLVMSIVNGLGAVSGIVSPYIVGLLIPDDTINQWRDVFWVTFGVCLVTSLFYVTFGSAEVQPWNTLSGDCGAPLQEVCASESSGEEEEEKKKKNKTEKAS